jgi:SAM-dependent methyltransferase
MGLDGLRDHYPELSDHPIIAPDIVDDGEKLGTIPPDSVDFVIANHFIEHCEDPIGTLAAHLGVLRPGGVLFWAVPDRRAGVDCLRPATSWPHLVRDHAEGPQWSRSRHYEEWARLVDLRLGSIAPAEVDAHARDLEARRYSIHFHVWSREEFSAFLRGCARETELPLEVLETVPNRHEFLVIARKAPA